ncbi:unnamed protein product [Closterium sp. Naga37s-1]|nr:unnamed protein product [Closterium sp. Naga37s-1]
MAAPRARLLLLHFLFLSALLTFFHGPSQADLLKAARDPLHSVPAAVDTDTPHPSDGVATSTASAPPPAPSARAAAPSAKPSSAWERAVAALKPAMYGAVAAMSVGAESDVPTDALRPLLAPDVVVTAKVRLLNAANLTSSGIVWQGLTCPSEGTLKPPSPTAALLYLRFEQRADSQNSATPLTSRTWPFADSAQPSPVYAAPLAFLSPIVSFRLYPGTPVGPAAQQKELSLVGLGGSTRRVNGFRLSAYAEAASESGRPAGGSAGQASGTRGSAGRGDSTSGEFVDTRIHWSSPDEGWVGGNSSGFSSEEEFEARSSDAGLRTAMSRDMQLLIMSNSNNHYTVLGVSPLADTDDVKAAYRRLSKRFHPDTTRLPLALAEQQFVRLNQAYEVLSSSEDRRLYDWKLAQEASDARGGRFVWPYEVDRTQRGMGSRDPPSPVGRRGPGEDENDVPLSDGSIMALAFDAFAVLIAVACICYAAFFKGN